MSWPCQLGVFPGVRGHILAAVNIMNAVEKAESGRRSGHRHLCQGEISNRAGSSPTSPQEGCRPVPFQLCLAITLLRAGTTVAVQHAGQTRRIKLERHQPSHFGLRVFQTPLATPLHNCSFSLTDDEALIMISAYSRTSYIDFVINQFGIRSSLRSPEWRPELFEFRKCA